MYTLVNIFCWIHVRDLSFATLSALQKTQCPALCFLLIFFLTLRIRIPPLTSRPVFSFLINDVRIHRTIPQNAEKKKTCTREGHHWGLPMLNFRTVSYQKKTAAQITAGWNRTDWLLETAGAAETGVWGPCCFCAVSRSVLDFGCFESFFFFLLIMHKLSANPGKLNS